MTMLKRFLVAYLEDKPFVDIALYLEKSYTQWLKCPAETTLVLLNSVEEFPLQPKKSRIKEDTVSIVVNTPKKKPKVAN